VGDRPVDRDARVLALRRVGTARLGDDPGLRRPRADRHDQIRFLRGAVDGLDTRVMALPRATGTGRAEARQMRALASKNAR
jgi:hypothetical protein